MTTDVLNVVISADTGNATQNIQNTADQLEKLGDAANTSDSDVSSLVQAMSTAAEQMVSIAQDIAASAGGMSSFESDIAGASSAVTGLNFRFDTLNSSVQSAYSVFDSAAASVGQLAQASDNSAASLDGITNATDGFEARMSALQAATNGTVDSMDAMRAEFSNALSSIRNFADNVDKAGEDAANASTQIQEFSQQVNKIPSGSNVGDLTKQFQSLKAVLATLGIAALVKDSDNAYNVQMQNELKLASHMKHRMNATNDEIESIKQLASEQQKLGIIGDEIQLAGAQQLTTYARQTSTLKTLIPAMNNLIAQQAGYEASTSDAISMADALGRALNGQYTSLKRMGVTFTEAQINVLKYGTESEKAAILADAINNKVGNLNELLTQTPTGQLKQLSNELGDFKEEIGALWQPMLGTYAPILRGLLETIREPIKNVVVGFTAIGQALAKLDSPVVRTIALTAAGIAVMSKLQLLIGATSARLLVLGIVLAGVIGKMSGAQTSVSDIVEQAMASAEAATDNASDAMGDYTESVTDAQKAVSRLAGFDTITKLTGGTQATLGSQLFSDDDISRISDVTDGIESATEAAEGLEAAVNGLDLSGFDIGAALKAGYDALVDINSIIFGDDDAKYEPLKRWTEKIKEVFGADWTDYWQGVGQGIYDIFSGDDSKALEGWRTLNDKIKDLFGEDFTEFWNGVGGSIYNIINGSESEIYKGWYDLNERVKSLLGEDFTQTFNQWGQDINKILNPDTVTQEEYTGAMTDYLDTLATVVGALNPIAGQTIQTGIEIMKPAADYAETVSQTAQERYFSTEYNAELASRYRGGMPSDVPIDNITVIMTMDGDVIGQTTQSIANAQTVTSNGLYGVD